MKKNQVEQTIDEMKALRDKLGENDLIKLAIEGSCFSTAETVADRHSVIVPAWANSLMDKDAQDGTLASKFQSTINEICCELYKGLNKGAGTFMSELQVETNDVVHGIYRINLLQKNDKEAGLKPSQHTIKI